MRIVTCASYYGTGSSAVTDFLSEFDSVTSLGDYEYRFAWDPDGLSDLEFNVVQNNTRINMPYAIDRFIKLMDSLTTIGYGKGYKIFGDDLKRYTDQFLDEITELKTYSYWIRNRIDKGELFCFIDRKWSALKKRLTRTEGNHSLLEGRKLTSFSTVSEEEFLAAAKRFTERLFGSVGKGSQFMMIDQLVPPTCTERYIRYFNDIKVIVVDRDPRDVYLFDRARWKTHKIPTANVEDYVKWVRITRKYSNPENEDRSKIMRIHFEDMIYHYEETAKKIMDFAGLDEKDHTRKRAFFDPDISIKNTDQKNRFSGYEKEIQYIEEQLPEYLYPFPASVQENL